MVNKKQNPDDKVYTYYIIDPRLKSGKNIVWVSFAKDPYHAIIELIRLRSSNKAMSIWLESWTIDNPEGFVVRTNEEVIDAWEGGTAEEDINFGDYGGGLAILEWGVLQSGDRSHAKRASLEYARDFTLKGHPILNVAFRSQKMNPMRNLGLMAQEIPTLAKLRQFILDLKIYEKTPEALEDRIIDSLGTKYVDILHKMRMEN